MESDTGDLCRRGGTGRRTTLRPCRVSQRALQVRILPPALSRRSSAQARARPSSTGCCRAVGLTKGESNELSGCASEWCYVRRRAFDSGDGSTLPGRGEIGRRSRLKSGRVALRLVHVRVVPPGPRATGSGVSRQRTGLPSRWCGIVARLPVHAEIAHEEERQRCISQGPVRIWLSAPNQSCLGSSVWPEHRPRNAKVGGSSPPPGSCAWSSNR